jgi:GDP-L-fucose synthase
MDRVGPGSRVYVAGHRGLVGQAVARQAVSRGAAVIGHSHADLDLADRTATLRALRASNPTHLVVAAAKVGGIMANATHPVEFLEENLRIQLSVISAAYEAGIPRLLFLGSSCIYPKLAPQPIDEDALLTGPLEPTNEAYAIAKIAGVKQIQAYRTEFGAHYVSAMPTNVYGPGDNFDLATSHVLPALIRRFHEAKEHGAITLWGTGTPRREFIHADDLGRACLAILDEYDEDEPINVGTGADLPINELAGIVADVVGFSGRISYDSAKPDGTPRKLLDVGRLTKLGWQPEIGLRDGIKTTYEWWLAHR